jgi:starvation-inducible DNA-binding protein
MVDSTLVGKMDTGITSTGRSHTAQALGRALSDTFTLYLKTHNYHWNVTGPNFAELHALFEAQYTELWQSVDEIAERIRALGSPAPGSMSEMASLTRIKDAKVENAQAMVSDLLAGHETTIKTLRAALEKSQSAGDESTVDLLVGRLRSHEKTAWMLRSILG